MTKILFIGTITIINQKQQNNLREKGVIYVSMYLVSDDNVDKVKRFFIRQSKETGLTVNMRVDEIAFHSGVALATAHKALQALSDEGFLEIERSACRRNANSYHVMSDIDIEEKKMSIEEELVYEKQQNRLLMEQVTRLRIELAQLRTQIKSSK